MPPSAISLVVCDAGPLIALGRLDRLGLLPALFHDVQVPQAVLAECVLRPELLDAQRIQSAVASGLFRIRAAKPVQVDGLGAGESAAIGLAMEISAALLADDLAARHYAHGVGLTVIGTLGVLVRAKRTGQVEAIRPLIDQLRASGQRLGQAAVAQALAAAGE